MSASFETADDGTLLHLKAHGRWIAADLGGIDAAIRRFADESMGRDLIIDLSGVERMDTAGAMVLQRTMTACQDRTGASRFDGVDGPEQALLDQAADNLAPCETEPPHVNAFLMMLNRLGRGAEDAYFTALEILSFLGFVMASLARAAASPGRLRMTSIVHHMEEAGLNAVPIIGLMSFLIGAVVAFMGARILSQFGAEIFTVELIGISVLREFGVLLTAILLAGRSGSAFTAQIGSMKIREEIDAMRALGLDPMDVLVLPRVIALVLMLPVLAFLSAGLGLIGGGLVAWSALDISPVLFVTRLQDAIVPANFWVGIIKAPFFAVVISIIGCYQGMKVAGSAESLGQRTTLSVVQSIFLVIVMDAFFAMFFMEINF